MEERTQKSGAAAQLKRWLPDFIISLVVVVALVCTVWDHVYHKRYTGLALMAGGALTSTIVFNTYIWIKRRQNRSRDGYNGFTE